LQVSTVRYALCFQILSGPALHRAERSHLWPKPELQPLLLCRGQASRQASPTLLPARACTKQTTDVMVRFVAVFL
jgi:hypothetical protein